MTKTQEKVVGLITKAAQISGAHVIAVARTDGDDDEPKIIGLMVLNTDETETVVDLLEREYTAMVYTTDEE